MAKGKGEVAGWITRNGVHVPIYGNYTVRGGEEPKAKGSKFKGAGKKRKKVDTSTTSGKTANDLNSNLKKKGLELDSADLSSMAHKDFNDEKVTMYDKDGNTYEGTYNKYKNGDREIVDIRKTGGRDTGKSEVSKGHTEEGKGAVKDVEGKKPEMYDWKQDRTDTQEERDAFAKEHEQGIKDRLAKINEQNKPKAKEETFKGSVLKKSDEKGEGYDWKKDRSDELDSDEIFEARERAYAKDEAAKKEGFLDAADKESFDIREKAYETRGLRGQAEKNDYHANAERILYSKNSDENIAKTEELVKSGMSYADAMKKVVSEMGPDTRKKSPMQEAYERKQAGQESSTPTISPKTQRVADNARKSLMFDKGYAEIAANQWSWAGMSNDKVIAAMNATDPKYSYELKKEQTKGLGGLPNATVNHNRLYRTEKNVGDTATNKSAGGGGNKEAKGSIPTTVSGLRSAYSEATGSEKAAIASELRKKGYSLIGGKWVKGK